MNWQKSYAVKINGKVYRSGLTKDAANQVADSLRIKWGPNLIVTVDDEGLFRMTPYIAVLCAIITLTVLLLVWFL